MEQDLKGTTNRRNFLISSAAAAGLILYPETLLFGQAAGDVCSPHDSSSRSVLERDGR